MFEDLLHTIAEVAVTLAGFSGVVFALGNRSGRKLSEAEKYGILHMLLTSFGPAVMALVAIAVLKASTDDLVAWRINCGIVGTYTVFGASRAIYDAYVGESSLPKVVAWLVPAGALTIALSNLLIALGVLNEFAEISCVSLLIYLIWVSMISFVSLLTGDRSYASAG